MSTTMQAIIVHSKGEALIKEIPVPKLRPSYVKVKVLAVALNPTDWKHIDYMADPGTIVGCDITGEVLEIGDQVKTPLSIGDHIYGFINGANNSNKEDGGFAEYAVIKDGMFNKVPANMSDQQAASFGVGVITCGQALYKTLKLPEPGQSRPSGSPKFPVLIYGGSTATGVLAIQFARQSGLEVLVTAGKDSFDLVRSFGADAVFDYRSEDCGARIRKYSNDKLFYVFDTIANQDSAHICAAALSSKAPTQGLHYSSLQPIQPFPREDVDSTSTLAYTAVGEEFVKLGRVFQADAEDYAFSSKWMALAGELISHGIVRNARIRVGEGGLAQVLNGLQDMRDAKVRGEKLVYNL